MTPCGGGGLAAGLALALPEAEVTIVEPEGWDDMCRSLEAGWIEADTAVRDTGGYLLRSYRQYARERCLQFLHLYVTTQTCTSDVVDHTRQRSGDV